MTVVVETEVIDGSGAAAVLLPSSAVAGGSARGIAVQLLRVSTPPLGTNKPVASKIDNAERHDLEQAAGALTFCAAVRSQ